MCLQADILVAAYHDSWGVFPEQEHIVVPKRLVYIFFESLIIEGLLETFRTVSISGRLPFVCYILSFSILQEKRKANAFRFSFLRREYMVN